jgi:hypothetical protein
MPNIAAKLGCNGNQGRIDPWAGTTGNAARARRGGISILSSIDGNPSA